MSAACETLPDGRLRFTGDDTFDAFHAALAWCDENGISYGPSCRSKVIGLLRGEWHIAKWRNLTRAERAACHGTLTGDARTGPVFIQMKPEVR